MEEYIDYKLKSGNILRVEQDKYPQESPNDWGNEDVFLVYDHRQFFVEREGFKPIDIFEYLENFDDDRYDEYYIFPVDAYIHSGVRISLANTKQYPDRRWDVSTTGYILVKKDIEIIAPDTAKKYAEGLIETWNQYLEGDVYGFRVLKPISTYTVDEDDLREIKVKGKNVLGNQVSDIIYYDRFLEKAKEAMEYEELDSCWGFYGSDPKTNGMLDNINDELLEEQ